MNLIDTHSHLYEPEFDADREEALARAFDAGVGLLLLPAIDAASDERLFALCRRHPDRSYVPDPYYEGHEGFELVLDLLEDGCEGILEHFAAERG